MEEEKASKEEDLWEVVNRAIKKGKELIRIEMFGSKYLDRKNI